MHLEKLAFWDWSYVKLWDEGNNVLPYHLTDVNSFFEKITSFWQPKYASGVDHLSTGTRTGLESILFSLLPSWVAYGVYKVLIFLLGSFFIFKLLRDRLKTEFVPAFLAGIAFITFKPDGFWDKVSVLALPAVLYALSWCEMQKGKGIFFAFLIGVLYELGAQITLTLTLLSTVIFWLLFIERFGFKRSTSLFLALSSGILATEIHTIWAFIANSSFSHRTHFITNAPEYRMFLKEWLVEILNGSALLLVLASMMVGIKSKGLLTEKSGIGQNVIVYLIAIGISLYMPAFEIIRYGFQNISPLIAGYSIPKGLDASIWFALSAGLSLELILKNDKSFQLFRTAKKASAATMIYFGVAVVISGNIFVAKLERLWAMLYDENFAYMYRHPDLRKLAETTKNDQPFRVSSPFILSDTGYIIPPFVWAYGFETADGYVSMYPERYHKYWLQILAAQKGTERYIQFRGQASAIYLFGNPTDRGPACPDDDTFFSMSCPVEFEKDYDLELLSLANVRYFISARKLASPHFSLLPSEIRDSLIERQRARLRQRLEAKLEGKYVGPPIYIYENKLAFPRFFMTGGVKMFSGEKDLLPALSEASASTLRSTAFVRRDDITSPELGAGLKQLPADGDSGGHVDIIRYERDEIVLQIETDSPRVFVAANNFSPYWKAELNDRPLTVFQVYNTFQGMLVPQGRHTLRLRYLPPYSPKTYFP